MTAVGIVPVRSFSMGKQRLAEALSESQRAALGEALASHVASKVADGGLIPLVVTADGEVAEWAIRNGFPTVQDPSTGLDDAVAAGIDWALSSGSAWLAIHSDLPLLSENDVRKLVDILDSDGHPIAPSVDGGTSAIGGRHRLETVYGPGSFHLHLARLARPEIVATTGLLHDIDSLESLASAAAHPSGAWLDRFGQ